MTTAQVYSTGELARLLNRERWKIREVVDILLGPDGCPRVAGRRVIPAKLLPKIKAELERLDRAKERK